MPTLLLFNILDDDKRTAIRILSFRLGYTFRDIPPEQQNMTISDLLFESEATAPVLSPFTDEMMVMYQLPSQDMHILLDSMRNNGCSVKLKCVVTETNKTWTATRLHKELTAEERAMSLRKKTKRSE